MKVLGIDPGSRVTGYGVVLKGAHGRLTRICDGEIAPGGTMALPLRLLAISEALKGVMDEHMPDAVALESVFFAKNPRSAIVLGEARGTALVCAAAKGIEVFEYAPRSIKLAVTGYGNAGKDQVQKMIKLLLKAGDTAGPDAADALAAAICHIHHAGRGGGAGASGKSTPRTQGAAGTV